MGRSFGAFLFSNVPEKLRENSSSLLSHSALYKQRYAHTFSEWLAQLGPRLAREPRLNEEMREVLGNISKTNPLLRIANRSNDLCPWLDYQPLTRQKWSRTLFPRSVREGTNAGPDRAAEIEPTPVPVRSGLSALSANTADHCVTCAADTSQRDWSSRWSEALLAGLVRWRCTVRCPDWSVRPKRTIPLPSRRTGSVNTVRTKRGGEIRIWRRSVGQRSSPWPCKFSERRDKISPRVQALLPCA